MGSEAELLVGSVVIHINRAMEDGGSDQRVYVKSDGKRFTDGKTLKLKTNSKYIIRIEVTPAKKVMDALFVNSVQQDILEIGGSKNNMFVYKAAFETNNIGVTGHSDRDTLIISAHLMGVGVIMVPIQTKYYGDEFRANSGFPLRNIVVDFEEFKDKHENVEVKITNARITTKPEKPAAEDPAPSALMKLKREKI